MKSEKEIIKMIDKALQLVSNGTDEELNKAVQELTVSVPFYEKIYDLIFFSNQVLTAEEIYQKAKAEHKPILI